MGASGGEMEGNQILHQLIHFFFLQDKVPSHGRMARQSDQNGMDRLLSFPLLF